MDKSKLELKVGVFVLVALVLLAIGIIELSKGTSFFRSTYELRLHAVDVGGLQNHSGVLLAGVKVGDVSDIQLAPDGKSVTIILKIYKDYKIYHDAQFVIEQSGFLGDKYVAIIPTTNQPPVLTNGAEVECEPPFNLQEVARSTAGFIERIDDTAKKLDASVSELQRVVLNGRTMTNFSVSIENLRVFTEQAIDTLNAINDVIATNGPQAGLAVSNVVVFSQQLTDFAQSANVLLATNGVDISDAVKNIETSTETLTNLLGQLRSGNGPAGELLYNETLSNNLQTIANNLVVTTSNLNRLGLWGFLWHKQLPQTNSPEMNQPNVAQSPRGANQ
ncbi:MAG TPA: MlaD family protein [Verrucomicrobiae bacterium]|nr:MlaD family protein [Verrucomicrobiae bacterium]